MFNYQVKFYKGDYSERQKEANKDGAVCYVEHHFNAGTNNDADYSMVVVARNASRKSIDWGSYYAQEVDKRFEAVKKAWGAKGKNLGVNIGGFNGRGNGNLIFTNMPAILVEPMFATDPEHADIIKSTEGSLVLAEILADSIMKFFPNGGLVAFSVGHKFKKSNPADRGVSLYGGGWEADYAEKVLNKAKILLEG